MARSGRAFYSERPRGYLADDSPTRIRKILLGRLADLIVAEMNRGGGIISEDELAEYEAVFREPAAGSYRGYRVLSIAPPSSGGIALLRLLNAVEPCSISKMGYSSSQTIHLMGEAMRRVYADRAKWLGDTDFYPVPVAGLIEKRYMHSRMSDLNPDRAANSSDVEHGDPFAGEPTETTHYSALPKDVQMGLEARELNLEMRDG